MAALVVLAVLVFASLSVVAALVAVALAFRPDDDTLVEVAAGAHDRTALVGPFLAAAIPGLPSAPRAPENLRRRP
jgi:hypothetical protein